MTASGFNALLPLITLGVGMVVIMLVIAFRRSLVASTVLTLLTLAVAFIRVFFSAAQGPQQVTPLLIFDNYTNLIIGLLLAATFVITLLAYGYLKVHAERREEFFLLLLGGALGGTILAASSHFASLFLGLEILSLSLYTMIGYTYNNPISLEAAVKYLILAASSAAFLLFGMALIYGELGTMEFAGIAAAIDKPLTLANQIFLLTGVVLILVGFGYKLALVPFHMWTPDVYQGAPAPVTAFVASVSKGSMFAVLVRFFAYVPPRNYAPLFTVFVVIAIATMLTGNILALLQNNIKRLLAYSSIAQLGYLLVAFLASGTHAIAASTFYLVSYFITILAAFGVVTVLSGPNHDADDIEEYRGLLWQRPWLAIILSVAMFSLIGIPLTVGFVGKFYLVLAAVGSALWLLAIVLVVAGGSGCTTTCAWWWSCSPAQKQRARFPVSLPSPRSRASLKASNLSRRRRRPHNSHRRPRWRLRAGWLWQSYSCCWSGWGSILPRCCG